MIKKTMLFLLVAGKAVAGEIHDGETVTENQQGIVRFESTQGPVLGKDTTTYPLSGHFPDLIVRLNQDDQQAWTDEASESLDDYLYEIRHRSDTVSVTVLFDSDKTRVNNPILLNKISESERNNPGAPVSVTGYTDSIGGYGKHNQNLSRQRADSVRLELEQRGVPKPNITVDGRGPADPVADNSTPEGRSLNRRVEVVVSPEGNNNAPD